jgi:hypothetical protein
MRESRRVAQAVSAQAVSAPEPFAAVDVVSEGSRSAMRVLAAAAQLPMHRDPSWPSPSPAAGPAPADRIDLTGLATVPPLRGPTVTGAASGRARDHVGGAMLPPPAPNTVSLSDGTRISFRAVEESPAFEYA